jgi:glycosyltransferase involved in cell wall biosynthesis
MSEKHIHLDLVLADAKGPYLNQIPQQVRLINLAAGGVMKAVLPLSRYLQQNRPFALVSHLNHANVAAILARELSRTKTRLVLVEHNNLSASKSKLIRSHFVKPFMQWLYPRSDAIVGVSLGVAHTLEKQLDLPKGRVITIYNPVIDRELLSQSQKPIDHPWFQKNFPPVFLAVGRLTEQKDFVTLIKAFALFRKQLMARLLILGEGESRSELEATINALGIAEDVSLPGFVSNPYAYMTNASAFILSSRWEGLPTVLIEAMACGCPVISTDCPSGPEEILEAGKYGHLIPIGDAVALSEAMLKILEHPVNQNLTVQKALQFSVDRSVSQYLEILDY